MSLEKALQRIEEVKKNNERFLDLSGLRLTEIPDTINELTQLQNLNLSINHIQEIQHLENLSKLTDLNLGENKITKIKGLENLTNLSQLTLRFNRITEITGLENLTQLDILSLATNSIDEIKGLEKLNRLNYLELFGNRITKITGLENLTQLTGLDLHNNLITEIKGLENLHQLTDLRLYKNLITEIKGLENLNNLDSLDLESNEISEIKGLESLKNLAFLDLSKNEIETFPANLLKSGLLVKWENDLVRRGIILKDNPLTTPPVEIIRQGNNAVKEYFAQLEKSGDELLNEAKLILLGDARSGKTSFANSLLKKPLPKEEDRTQGVNIVIGEYHFPLADGKIFKINIWDFAGHEKYKTLHQLFYTESCVYVMVAESGNEKIDYDDWLQTASVFGEGSPLVLILNEFKKGIGMGSFDSKYWKGQFPELLKEVFTVNLGTKQNFSAAEEFIQVLAKNLPHTKYAFPKNWAAIRQVLHLRRNEQYITLQHYLQICKDNDLPEKDSALILSSVLHKIGDCLHYQKNDLLKQFIILKNEWATDAVYKILDDKVVAEEKCGFFNRRDTERIWCSTEYEDMRPQLLELMKQFKLAYQLPGKDEYVTPPLLPPAQPVNYSWPEIESLELYIDYEFLPKALLTQFIVTRHADIADGKKLVWRHGVVLKWEGEALAEVSKTKLKGKDAFRIRTQGKSRKEMITLILKTFRELHGEYKGIKYTEKVPCICAGCRAGKNEQYYFEFENLKFRVKKRKFEVDCEKSLENVNVLELLENSFLLETIKGEKKAELKGIKTLNLFLASSYELKKEREQIEIALARKNDELRKHGFYIDLLIWEDRKHAGTSLRSQNDYNLDIQKSDLFVMLFYSKVGKYTQEEFELAKSLFEKDSMPRICIFQKDIDLPKGQSEEDASSRFEFLKILKTIEHFQSPFANTEGLVHELEKLIDKLLQDNNFIQRLKSE